MQFLPLSHPQSPGASQSHICSGCGVRTQRKQIWFQVTGSDPLGGQDVPGKETWTPRMVSAKCQWQRSRQGHWWSLVKKGAGQQERCGRRPHARLSPDFCLP